jgi:para-nitrobenzyl esterase
MLLAVALAAPALARGTDPVVATDEGKVRGEAIGSGAAFRGIPFAAPPVGRLRWREAQPLKPWRGLRDARAFGATCIQPTTPATAALPQSEDCLTLNVVTPDRKAHGLPVLVSIHGGAFFVGSGRYIADHDLSPIVRRGVVLVSPNYRVGRMGFFAHPALNAEAGRGTGNFWLSDQIAALAWVKRNIARFGGDPAKVTILGCSAGGSSINSLMASPAARGLFAHASSHSGGGFFNASRPMADALAQGLAFAARAGVSDTGATGLARLRALTAADVLAADPGPPNFGAIVDGRLLPRQISETFAAGGQARVPFLVGSTSNEASIFGLMGFDPKVLHDRFNIDFEQVRAIYEKAGALSEAELLRRIETDFLFTSAAQGMAGLAARAAPAWSYYFDYVAPGKRTEEPGAPHCADMGHTFALDEPVSDTDRQVDAMLQGYAYNFIATGDPNGPGLPAWPSVIPGHPAPLRIGDATAADPGFKSTELAYWFAKWRAETGLSVEP